MSKQKQIDLTRGSYAPGFPIDGVEFAIEETEQGEFRIHGWLVLESTKNYPLQPSQPIKRSDLDNASYRIEFPHRVVLYGSAGRTDERA